MASGVKDCVLRAREKSTVARYEDGFKRFEKWAANFEEVSALPAKPAHVAAYFVHIMDESRSYHAVETAFTPSNGSTI